MPWEWRDADLNECDHDSLPVSGHSTGYWHYDCSNCGASWTEVCENHDGCSGEGDHSGWQMRGV